jgi:hypothetical protein
VKIKSIFILYNSIAVFFLVTIGATFGIGNGSSSLGAQLWLPVAICVATLFILDTYYLLNVKLFTLLEKDDWPALIQYLETEVLSKGRYSPRSVRLLAQTYFTLSDTAAIENLENKTALANPRLIETLALIFGTARLLEKNMNTAANFFSARIHARKPNKRDLYWLRFYYGFTMLLDWRFAEACDEFIILTKISNNSVITGLSAWFLSDYLDKALPDRREDIASAIESAQKQVKEAVYDLRQWNSKISKIQNEPHAALITQYLIKTGEWIFDNGPAVPDDVRPGGSKE